MLLDGFATRCRHVSTGRQYRLHDLVLTEALAKKKREVIDKYGVEAQPSCCQLGIENWLVVSRKQHLRPVRPWTTKRSIPICSALRSQLSGEMSNDKPCHLH